MRAVVQRVSRAKVTVGHDVVGEIGRGILVLLGVRIDDTERDAAVLVEKAINLRIFDDEQGKMNRSLLDVRGGLLVVSQFTLYGDARKGRRPSYMEAARPQEANRLYEIFVNDARNYVDNVASGRFQAVMNVELINQGPVTIILESPAK